MKPLRSIPTLALALAFGALMATQPALADGPRRHGHGHDDAYEPWHSHFEDRHRVVVHEYYVHEYHAGHCPPGLYRKHNGCRPPGHARAWEYGRPLPRGVVYYELPPVLVTRIGPPPAGHRYVRVAGDILLIAIGTGMVVDAIQDLSR